MPIILDEKLAVYTDELVRIVYDVADKLDFPPTAAHNSGAEFNPVYLRGTHQTVEIEINEEKLHSGSDKLIVGYVYVQPQNDSSCRLTIERIKPKAYMQWIETTDRQGIKPAPHPEITILTPEDVDRVKWFRAFAYQILVKADSQERAETWDREHGKYGIHTLKEVDFIHFPSEAAKQRYFEEREEAIADKQARMKERGEEAATVFNGRCKDEGRLVEAIEAFVNEHIPPNVGDYNPNLHSGYVNLSYKGVPRRYEICADASGWGDKPIGHFEVWALNDTEYEFKVVRYGNDLPDWAEYDYEAVRGFFDGLAKKLRKDYWDYTEPTSKKQLPDAVPVRRKRRMSVHFHRGYLLLGLVLAAITFVCSLIVYPEWIQSNKSVFALLVLIMLGVPTFIANVRNAFEASSSQVTSKASSTEDRET